MLLRCPVRGCQLALLRDNRRVLCPRGHSFDIAKSGYINLLQPQERRSSKPGDSTEAVAARRRLHDLGIALPFAEAIDDIAEVSLSDVSSKVVLDAGCGDGYYLGTLSRKYGFVAHGVDISVAAIELASRRYPECEWIVANADRLIPFADEAFSLILSITARMNPVEFRRVLRGDGRLLVAIPAPDDLMELRGAGRDRVDRTVQTFAPQFTLVRRERVSTAVDLEAAAVHDILHSIYRPLQSELPRAMRVTFSLDMLLFEAS